MSGAERAAGGEVSGLVVQGVTKHYGDHRALDDVSLTVAPGEVCGLLGPNGAGKTTLVSIIAGLRTPDAGTVTVAGLDAVGGGAAARRAVGLAAQETSIYPVLPVRENLELFTRLAGFRGPAVARRIDEVSEVVELTHLLDRPARNLSGGERRRLHTAMALVHRPRVLLLDEPTTGVDIGTRSRLLAAITELAATEGCAVLYSTHYLPEIEELGASVAIVDHGRILARGPLDELVAQHGSGMVELTFEGPPPTLEGGLVEGSIVRIPTDDPAATAAALLAGLGPDAERLTAVELGRPSLETVFIAITGRAYRAEGADPPPDTGPPGAEPTPAPGEPTEADRATVPEGVSTVASGEEASP